MIGKYRKKPVEIEAVQWTGDNLKEVVDFMGDASCKYSLSFMASPVLVIHTLEGDHQARVGDYIIKGVHGEFYPCKPDIFEETYERSCSPQPALGADWTTMVIPSLPCAETSCYHNIECTCDLVGYKGPTMKGECNHYEQD